MESLNRVFITWVKKVHLERLRKAVKILVPCMKKLVNKRKKVEAVASIDFIFTKHLYYWTLENIYNFGMVKFQNKLKRIHTEQEKERQFLITGKLIKIFNKTKGGVSKGIETIIYHLKSHTLNYRFYQWKKETEINNDQVCKKMSVNLLKSLIKNSLNGDNNGIELKLSKDDIIKLKKELSKD